MTASSRNVSLRGDGPYLRLGPGLEGKTPEHSNRTQIDGTSGWKKWKDEFQDTERETLKSLVRGDRRRKSPRPSQLLVPEWSSQHTSDDDIHESPSRRRSDGKRSLDAG